MSILVIDIGSSSARTLLIDADLRVITESMSRFYYQFTHAPDGTAEVDVIYLRQGLEGCMDETLKYAAKYPIEAVGMACFASSLLGLDQAEMPVTPVYTYADSRCASAVSVLAGRLDGEALRQRTGCPLHSAYYPAKLQWLQESVSVNSVVQWLDFSTYVYRVWFGHAVPMSYSIASWTGLLNHDALTWDEEMLEQLRLTDACFPPLADYDTVQMGLADTYASRWPQLTNVPFYLAVGDGAAANMGSGGDTLGQVVLTVGTTAALRVVSEVAPSVMPAGLWKYRVDAKRYLLGGATSEGGNIFQWARDVLALTPDTIEAFLKQAEPDAHHLTVLPLLAGERSPGYAVNAVGTLHGLRLSTTAEDMLQALLEAVALRLRKIAYRLGDMEQQTIYAGGGALMASAAWAQIITNALGCNVHLVDEPEVTARGIAVLLLGRDFAVSDLRIVSKIEPDYTATEIYTKALQRQDALYEKFYSSEQ